jgi:hypothetical protein
MSPLAVYDEQVIRHLQAHVARRRALRPSEEYREPTAAEWAEFEHACVRCPMLRMDPDQLPRLLAIEQDTHRLLAEARANGWDGEALALETTTLTAVGEKKAQAERLQTTIPSQGGKPIVCLSLDSGPTGKATTARSAAAQRRS